MKNLLLVAYLDLKEALRSKWFYVYAAVFGGLMALFFLTGVSDSVVMGFTGLSRMLLIFIQVTVIILPIFILITTVKSISGDRESHVLEYMLSFPVSLRDYYWGKMTGRFVTVFMPVFLALLLGVAFGMIKGGAIPWKMVLFYTALLFSLSFFFLGLAFFLSTLVKSTDIALGGAFVIWIVMLAFIDIALIGLMLQNRMSDDVIVAIAMLNPVEVFRIGAISLFDPELTVIGPVAYYLLDTLGSTLLMAYALMYPIVLGMILAWFGYRAFKKRDLL